MRVNVNYYGVLKDLAGSRMRALELQEPASVDDALRQSLGAEPVWRSIAVAVNGTYATRETALQDGDEVSLLPPVSGRILMRVEILQSVLPVAAAVDQIKVGSDGAVCVFDGIVRNNTRGRQTLHLDYEAHPTMALSEMQSLAAAALERFAVRDITLLHRIGRLEIGESSVLIVIASAHRGPAFEACRWVIDTLKKQVPIWKKETFADGAEWIDGDPFPAELGLNAS